MEDVTDTVFRRIVAKNGRPDVFFTEFTNIDALDTKGWETVSKRLIYTEEERPLVAQIWGLRPEKYYEAAKRLVAMGFDGIDINMGCPERSVVKHGACSALIKDHPRAKEIIDATKRGANGEVPVSVKTRIGFNQIQTEEWTGFLLEQDLPVLTVHGRTVKEMSKVPAHWDEIGKVVRLRDQMSIGTLIVGNGDVESYRDGLEKAKTYGVDGIMIGRGVFHNFYIFDKTKNWSEATTGEKLAIMRSHILLYEKTWEGKKHYQILKKFFKIYVSGFDGASDVRAKFMETKTAEEALRLLQTLLSDPLIHAA